MEFSKKKEEKIEFDVGWGEESFKIYGIYKRREGGFSLCFAMPSSAYCESNNCFTVFFEGGRGWRGDRFSSSDDILGNLIDYKNVPSTQPSRDNFSRFLSTVTFFGTRKCLPFWMANEEWEKWCFTQRDLVGKSREQVWRRKLFLIKN